MDDEKQPIAVLYCILDNRFGGPHRLALATARWLRQHAIETVFLLGHKSGPVWKPDTFPVFPLKHIQFLSRQHPLLNLMRFCVALPLNLVRIRRIIRSHQIDVVHIDGVTNFVPALAARLTRTPVVCHYNDHPPRLFRWFLLPLITALSQRVIVQGEKLKEVRTGDYPKLARKTTVIHSGLDIRQFDPGRYDAASRAQLRKALGLPAQCPLIGTIGNLNRFKGHNHFLEAAHRITRTMAEARFIIVGRRLETDAGYWNQLQRQIAELGLRENVIFTGFRDDIPAILSILDVFVLPSVLESCPCVLLEAMAMKAPVVTTDVGATSELVIQGRTGRVVPSRDAAALAEAVLGYLTAPPEQTRTLVETARKRVETEFGIDTIAEKQRRIYEDLGRHRTL